MHFNYYSAAKYANLSAECDVIVLYRHRNNARLLICFKSRASRFASTELHSSNIAIAQLISHRRTTPTHRIFTNVFESYKMSKIPEFSRVLTPSHDVREIPITRCVPQTRLQLAGKICSTRIVISFTTEKSTSLVKTLGVTRKY